MAKARCCFFPDVFVKMGADWEDLGSNQCKRIQSWSLLFVILKLSTRTWNGCQISTIARHCRNWAFHNRMHQARMVDRNVEIRGFVDAKIESPDIFWCACLRSCPYYFSKIPNLHQEFVKWFQFFSGSIFQEYVGKLVEDVNACWRCQCKSSLLSQREDTSTLTAGYSIGFCATLHMLFKHEVI